MQAHNITALAAGRMRWLQAGADPEQRELFEVHAAELDTAGVAYGLADQMKDLAREVVTGAWAETAGDTTAA